MADKILHVYPVGDKWRHDLDSLGCWCNPTLEEQENGVIVVKHNSIDGREKKERNEKSN